jgi:YD repeat-containing protein
VSSAGGAIGEAFQSEDPQRKFATAFANKPPALPKVPSLGGRLCSWTLRDQSTNTTWFGYDALDRLTNVTNALGQVIILIQAQLRAESDVELQPAEMPATPV